MQPQRIVGIILLVGGIVLLVMGIQASDSFSSNFSKFFTGNPTDRAMWLTFGGLAGIVAGIAAVAIPSRSGRA